MGRSRELSHQNQGSVGTACFLRGLSCRPGQAHSHSSRCPGMSLEWGPFTSWDFPPVPHPPALHLTCLPLWMPLPSRHLHGLLASAPLPLPQLETGPCSPGPARKQLLQVPARAWRGAGENTETWRCSLDSEPIAWGSLNPFFLKEAGPSRRVGLCTGVGQEPWQQRLEQGRPAPGLP